MRLTALGGGSRLGLPGESFLLERGPTEPHPAHPQSGAAFRAVIDVGSPGSGIARSAASSRPHFLVLTHDDDDHVGGVDDFWRGCWDLKHRVDEVWVPSDWLLMLDALNNLVRHEPTWSEIAGLDPGALTEAIMTGGGLDSRLLPVTDTGQAAHGSAEAIGHLLDGLSAALEQRSEAIGAAVAEAVDEHRQTLLARPGDNGGKWTGTSAAVAKRVLKRSLLVLRTIGQAAISGRLRWFSTDAARGHGPLPWLTSGDPGRLTVVNAREVLPVGGRLVARPAEVLLLVSRLSLTNRRALVTYGWNGSNIDGLPRADGALMWSDSDQSVPGAPWEHVGIMTAPHHGSTDSGHDAIWGLRPHQVPVLLSNNARPTRPDFLDLRSDLRSCTRCPYLKPTASPPRDAVARVKDGLWTVDEPCTRASGCAQP